MDGLLILAVSWFVLIGIVYLLNKSAVRYFLAIYWKSEKLVRYVEVFTRRLSFVPLRAYLVVVLILFAVPVFVAIPFVRPDGQIQILWGFLYMLVGGTLNALGALFRGAPPEEAAARSAGVTP
ncbi:MAG: peptidase M50, partial [Pyrobaculum sp.]